MSFEKFQPTIVKVFAASALGLAITGCASVPATKARGCMDETKSNLLFLFTYSKSEFNRECALNDVAEQYSKSSDIGEQIIGQGLKEQLDPRAKAEADRAREALRGYKADAPQVINGRKVMVLKPLAVEPAATVVPLAPQPVSP